MMLAIHAVYLKKYSEVSDELSFIETPLIVYFNELETLLYFTTHQQLMNAILELIDESTWVEFALSLVITTELPKIEQI